MSNRQSHFLSVQLLKDAKELQSQFGPYTNLAFREFFPALNFPGQDKITVLCWPGNHPDTVESNGLVILLRGGIIPINCQSVSMQRNCFLRA